MYWWSSSSNSKEWHMPCQSYGFNSQVMLEIAYFEYIVMTLYKSGCQIHKHRRESTSKYHGIIIGHNQMTTVLAQYSSVSLMLWYNSKMQKNTQLLLHWTEVYWFPKCNACRGSQRMFCQFPGPFLEFLDGRGIRLTLAKAALLLYFDY